jgi:hypothetical protein
LFEIIIEYFGSKVESVFDELLVKVDFQVALTVVLVFANGVAAGQVAEQECLEIGLFGRDGFEKLPLFLQLLMLFYGFFL